MILGIDCLLQHQTIHKIILKGHRPQVQDTINTVIVQAEPQCTPLTHWVSHHESTIKTDDPSYLNDSYHKRGRPGVPIGSRSKSVKERRRKVPCGQGRSRKQDRKVQCHQNGLGRPGKATE